MKRLWNDFGWLLPVILWWGSVLCAGYVAGGAIKEWAKSHIIVVKEIQ